MFRTVSLSVISSLTLYTQQQVYVIHVLLQTCCCVYSDDSDDGQRNCPKHVEFYSKHKFEKLVHPVGFIIRRVAVQFIIITEYSNRRYSYSLRA
jgi:hypothetical protein